ncbi:MAG TPA: PKD domain-containing protein, partial [Chitinophagaceae bacterium]
NGTPYDPDMIILNPVEQNISNVTLVSSNLVAPQNQQHHLHVIMRNDGSGISSFRLDGTVIPSSSWVVHPGDPTYSYLYLSNVAQGFHTLRSDSGFNALAYGYANAESYGYSAGANVKDLYQFVSILNQYATVNYPATCKNTPFFFRIVLPYQPTQLQWVFGTTLNGMGIADVSQTNPVYDSTWLVNGRRVYRFSIAVPYSIPAIGTYPIKIVANNPTSDGCSGVQEIDYDLQVFEPPVAAFSFTGDGCSTGPVLFSDNSNTSGQPTIRWIWDLGDNNAPATQNPQHSYAQPGTYNVSLAVITDIGCISPVVVKPVTIHPQPVTGFKISASPHCAKQDITITDTSSVLTGTIVKWNWNMGDGNNFIRTSAAPFIHKYNAAGNYTISLQVETDKGCLSPVITKTIAVNALPKAGFISPEICLTDPFAPFADTSSIVTGTVAAWQWNFGDATATPANPNTSALQSPTHKYPTTGSYTATLIVTSDQGCKDTVAQTFTVNGSIPVADFTVQNPATLCSNRQVTISNTSAVDFGQVVKTEIYWDWTNAPGNVIVDDLPTAGKLYTNTYPEFNTPASKTYTVRMVSYSGASCLDEVIKTITVLATPAVYFNTIPEVCSNATSFQLTQAGITNTLPGSGSFSGTGVSPAGIFNPATGAGTYTIRYTYTGSNSCTNYAEQTIVVHPTPIANAGPDKMVLEGGAVQLTPALITAYPVTYNWTPPTGLSNTAIAGPLASPTDDITYTLKVTSAFGCNTSDDVFVKVLKLPVIPNVFTPNGDGVNDKFVIQYLESYPGCVVEIYNRYGQIVFRSIGYSKPWDGNFNGKPVPAGTYYYIVDPKNGRKRVGGFVDVVR